MRKELTSQQKNIRFAARVLTIITIVATIACTIFYTYRSAIVTDNSTIRIIYDILVGLTVLCFSTLLWLITNTTDITRFTMAFIGFLISLIFGCFAGHILNVETNMICVVSMATLAMLWVILGITNYIIDKKNT